MEDKSLASDLSRIIETVSLAKNADDFFDIACKIIFLLKDKTKEEIKKEIILQRRESGKRAVYDELLHGIFANESFNSSLFKIMSYESAEENKLKNKHILDKRKITKEQSLSEDELQNRYREINIKQRLEKKTLEKSLILSNKKENETVHYGLHLSFLLIVFVADFLSETTIIYLRNQLGYFIKQTGKFQNQKFHRLEILKVMNKISYNSEYNFKKPYNKKIKDKIISDNLQSSKNMLGVALIVLSQQQLISLSFKKMSVSIKKDKGNYKFYRDINALCYKMKFVEASLVEYKNRYREIFDNNVLDNFYNKFVKKTEKNTFFVLRSMTESLKSHNNRSVWPTILSFVEKSENIKIDISSFFQENFSAFSEKYIEDGDWSNKLFIISLKSLTVFESIIESKNDSWKISVFLNEYIIWIEEINKILNKHSLEDDWEKIEEFLVQENTNVEWKSTFYTSTEEEYKNEKTEKALARTILNLIVTPMLGMMNTNGGVILVGVIENYESIKREYLKKHLVKKNGYNFFNVNYELEKKRKDMDSVKREIQDLLFARTGFTAEKFNNLWTIEALEIKQDDEVATIYKIIIEKSNKLIYEYEKKSDSGMKESISLIKRGDGRTIYVDPRDYLK